MRSYRVLLIMEEITITQVRLKLVLNCSENWYESRPMLHLVFILIRLFRDPLFCVNPCRFVMFQSFAFPYRLSPACTLIVMAWIVICVLLHQEALLEQWGSFFWPELSLPTLGFIKKIVHFLNILSPVLWPHAKFFKHRNEPHLMARSPNKAHSSNERTQMK